MPSFQISDAPVRLDLSPPGPDGVTPPGRMNFTIRNMGPRAQSGRIRIEPTKSADPGWLALAGAPDTSPSELELEFDYGGTHDIEAIIRPPVGAKAGSYGFRLRVVAESDPDVDVTQGPEVGFSLTESAKPAVAPSKFPWWAVAVAAVMVLVVGGAVAWFALRPADTSIAMPDVTEKDAGAASIVLSAIASGVSFSMDGSGGLAPLLVISSSPEPGGKLAPGKIVALKVKAPSGACTSLICQFPGAEFPSPELAKLAAVGFDSKYAPAVSRDGNQIRVDQAKLDQIAAQGTGGVGPKPLKCPPICIGIFGHFQNALPKQVNPDVLNQMEAIMRANPGLSIRHLDQ